MLLDRVSVLVKVVKFVIGMKFWVGLKLGFFVISGRMEMVWLWLRKKVVLLGDVVFSVWVVIWLLVLGLFFMSMVVLREVCSVLVSSWLMVLVLLLVGKLMSRWMGLFWVLVVKGRVVSVVRLVMVW